MLIHEAPPEAFPAPTNAYLWSPLTKKWYDKKGNTLTY
jgi:hypothetical protein